MNTRTFLISTITLPLCVSVANAQACCNWRGSGGWGPGGGYHKMYNTASVETLSGVVESVDSFRPMRGMGGGIHIKLKTDKEIVPVHLGPAWYIERLDTKIEKGDKVDVKGSRIEFSSKPAIIAAELKKGEVTLVFRDSAGYPAWSGWRK